MILTTCLPSIGMADDGKTDSKDHAICAGAYAVAAGAVDYKIQSLILQGEENRIQRNLRVDEATKRIQITGGNPNHWEYRQLGGTDNPRGIYT